MVRSRQSRIRAFNFFFLKGTSAFLSSLPPSLVHVLCAFTERTMRSAWEGKTQGLASNGKNWANQNSRPTQQGIGRLEKNILNTVWINIHNVCSTPICHYSLTIIWMVLQKPWALCQYCNTEWLESLGFHYEEYVKNLINMHYWSEFILHINGEGGGLYEHAYYTYTENVGDELYKP